MLKFTPTVLVQCKGSPKKHDELQILKQLVYIAVEKFHKPWTECVLISLAPGIYPQRFSFVWNLVQGPPFPPVNLFRCIGRYFMWIYQAFQVYSRFSSFSVCHICSHSKRRSPLSANTPWSEGCYWTEQSERGLWWRGRLVPAEKFWLTNNNIRS